MKRVLLRARKGPFEVVSPENTLQRNMVATNAGNLLFSHAAHKILLTEDTQVYPNQNRAEPDEADKINEQYDVFVIPLANAFRLDFEDYLIRLTKLIERLRIPVVVFGVGAQSDLTYDPAPLKPIEGSVKAFVRAVLDKSASIGVRGEFTQEYLTSLGFHDVDVIGCPSMFLWGADLHVEKKAGALSPESRLSINLSPYVHQMGGTMVSSRLEGDIVMSHYRRYPHLTYIAQDTDSLKTILWGDAPEDVGKSSDIPIYTSHPLYRENKIRYFADPWTWLTYLTDFDFAFGTRIHGNMAALLAGTPCYVLAHDSRTLEMARYFEIPHRKMTEVSPDVDAAQLYAEADFSAMHNNHKQRLDTLINFLEKHDLDHIFAQRQSAGAGPAGTSFDERVRAVSFPPPIETLTSPPPDHKELVSRVRWLRDTNTELKTKVDRLERVTKRVEALEQNARQGDSPERLTRRVEALEREAKVAAKSPYRRARRLAGRVLRAVGLRR